MVPPMVIEAGMISAAGGVPLWPVMTSPPLPSDEVVYCARKEVGSSKNNNNSSRSMRLATGCSNRDGVPVIRTLVMAAMFWFMV